MAALANALVGSGLKVTVFTLAETPGITTEAGVQVSRHRSTKMIANVLGFPLPGTKKYIQDRIRASDIDIVSVHTRFFPMTFIGVRIARTLRIPVILTEHGSDHVRGVSPVIGMASKFVDLTLGRYVLRKSTSVLAISESAQAFVWRLASVTSRVFRNAIDTARFVEGKPTRTGPTRLVFLGRLVPGKGWPLVLEVAEQLASEGQTFEVHFIGDGPDRTALETAVGRSPIADRVTIHGRLGLDEIASYLQNAILLNPTALAEGFQTTLLEAIACRAAIVSTPVAAAEYLYGLGAQIDIVEVGDTQTWTEKTRNRLLNGKIDAQPGLLSQFDWSVRSREYVQILNSISPKE